MASSVSTPRRRRRPHDPPPWATQQQQQQQQEQEQPQTPASIKKRLGKGCFMDGIWLCNCEPRKQANLLEVKKQGKNQGRFFYKCFDCNFFLWWESAKDRERGPTSPSSGVTAEPPRPRTPSLTQTPLTAYGYKVEASGHRSGAAPEGAAGGSSGDETEWAGISSFPPDEGVFPSQPSPPQTAAMETTTPSRQVSKRKRAVFEDDGDDDEFGDLGSDEERQLADLADRSAEKMAAAQRAYPTPATNRSRDVMSGDPEPSVARTLFTEPQSKRQKRSSFSEATPSATLSSGTVVATTPSTPGTVAALSSSQLDTPSSSPSGAGADFAEKVMGLLDGQGVDPKVLTSVKDLLATAARRMRGHALGVETTRASLQKRNEKVAELQERIVALENQNRALREQRTEMKASLMKVYEEN